MSAATTIEWTDSTFNPWLGCTKVSLAESGGGGCDGCYAAVSTPIRVLRGKGIETWGAGARRQRTSQAYWQQPLRWNDAPFLECSHCRWRGDARSAALKPDESEKGGASARVCPTCGHADPKEARRRVFCASAADVLDNEVDPQWRCELLELIFKTPKLDWLVLTKRIGNLVPMLNEVRRLVSYEDKREFWLWLKAWENGEEAPANIWLGVTVVNQREADRDVPKLLGILARIHFVSIEPMRGGVDLTNIAPPVVEGRQWHGINALAPYNRSLRGTIDWVIAGGESGPKARPAHPSWFTSLRDQCARHGVPFLFKQWGEWRPVSQGEPDWFRTLYRSNRRARRGQDQAALDESYGRTCQVPEAVIHADGAGFDDIVAPGAFQQGSDACLTFKVGKPAAGRLLDGALHDAYPTILSGQTANASHAAAAQAT